MGLRRRARRAARSSPATSPNATTRSRSSSTTPPPRSSWPPSPPIRTRDAGSSSSCSPAPACAPASSARSRPTPWSRIGDTHWLRIPVGKLHNDRYVPLHPILVELITDWLATRPPSRSGLLVERDDGQPFDRRTVHRYVAAVAKRAGIGHVHPHQLRHTLATQAINRGMSLEAIAALLGHRSMRMTLTYARIADRTVADEYFRVTEAVEAIYRDRPAAARRRRGPNMRRLAADHRRLLGNGHCTRPAALDCRFETICERCGFFDTGPEFIAILRRQRDHATDHDDHDRAQIFTGLLDGIDDTR